MAGIVPSISVTDPVIEARELYYDYDDQITALRNINVKIFRGEFTAIIGQNGSGKTTLVKNFNGLLRPASGSVFVGGKDTKKTSPAAIAKTVGFVFQNPDHQIFCPTVKEELAFGPLNINMPAEAAGEAVRDAMCKFALEPYADHPPAILGFGIRRKVGLAAIYAMRPDVLILDEPTMGLDRKSVLELMGIVTDLNNTGHTILLITHDMRVVAEFTRRSIVLQNGEIAAAGPTRDLLADFKLLEKTGMLPPQIVQLSDKLIGRGLPHHVFSNGEFLEKYRKGPG